MPPAPIREFILPNNGNPINKQKTNSLGLKKLNININQESRNLFF